MEFSFYTVADSKGRFGFLRRQRKWFTHGISLEKTADGYEAKKGTQAANPLDARGRLTIADLANKPLQVTATPDVLYIIERKR